MKKIKLIENFTISSEEIKKVSLNESNQNIKYEGKEVSCVGAYTFPVTRPGKKNLNERLYTHKLWEKVIKEGQAVGSFGLCDHPEGEGSVKDAWCVWKNPRFNEDRSLVLVDAYLFGTWGRHAKEALDAGGNLGLSSVAYGEFKEDGFTIEESNFELIRFADWVLNPSYEVYGDKEMVINKEEVKENFEDPNVVIDDELENSEPISDMEDDNLEVEANNELAELENDAIINPAIDDSDLDVTYATDEVVEEDEEVDPELDNEVVDNTVIPDVELDDYPLDESKKKKEDSDDNEDDDDEDDDNDDNDNEDEDSDEEKSKDKKENTIKESVSLELNESILKENEALKARVKLSNKLLENVRNYARTYKEESEALINEMKNTFSVEEMKEARLYSESLELEIFELKAKIKEMEDDISNSKKLNEAVTSKDKEIEALKEENDELNRVQMLFRDTTMRKTTKDSFKMNIRNDEEVKRWYETMEASMPGIIIIKEDILRCKTVEEAQSTYFRHKSQISENYYVDATDREIKESKKYTF